MKKILPLLLTIALFISLYVIKTQKDDKDEMLKSFKSLEFSLNKSNENLDRFNDYKLLLLLDEARNRPDEVSPYYRRAEKVKKISSEFVDFIESIKNEIKGHLDKDNGLCDNYFFYTSDNKAKKITTKLDSTRYKLLDLLNDGEGVRLDLRNSEKITIQPYLLTIYDSGRYSSWANMYFKHSTFDETITLLSKLQNDCINLETDIVRLLGMGIDHSYCGFDILEAKVIPNAKMVKVGSPYKAEIFLHSLYDASIFEVVANGKKLPLEDGKRVYSITPASPGVYYLEGIIQLRESTGIKEYPFKEKFEAY